MAHLSVTCYRHMAVDNFGRLLQAPATPVLAEISLDITHENQVSDPFPEYTAFIHVKAVGEACALAFSEKGKPDPVADPDFHHVDAGETRWYGVKEGGKIAVIEVLT